MHPSQQIPLTPEEEAECEKEFPFMNMYSTLLQYGLDLFEPHGDVNGAGLESLEFLLEHFEKKDSPCRCVQLRRLIAEYKKRWPYRQANYSLN